MRGLEGQSEWLRVGLMGIREPWMVLEQERSSLLIGLF